MALRRLCLVCLSVLLCSYVEMHQGLVETLDLLLEDLFSVGFRLMPVSEPHALALPSVAISELSQLSNH